MSFRSRRYIPAIFFLAMVFVLSGCSLSQSSSASSESSSKIISSPFLSSSASSSPDTSNKYRDDVEGYTYAYVRSSSLDYTGFQKGLGEIAAKYGITNWEAQPVTYNAIGRGLKKAKLTGVEYETFKKNLAAGEYSKMQDIQKGYDSRD